MKKKIIGIDLDETLIQTRLFEETSKEIGMKFDVKTKCRWDLKNYPLKFRNAMFRNFNNIRIMCDDVFISPLAIKKLKLWKKIGHDIVIITARHMNIKKQTERMLYSRIGKIFKNLLFVGDTPKKEHFINEKLNVWIDDHPIDTKDAVDIGINTFLISNKRTPYNYSMRNYKNISVVESLSDVKI